MNRSPAAIAILLREHRAEILRLADKHGATNVRVFGSAVHGKAGPTSDIDFLVDWDMERISAWGGAGLDVELEQLLGRAVDVVSAEDLHWCIRERVLEEAVAL
jgi:uncharacterized protein